MTVYQYPTNSELQEIERDLLPVLTMDDPIFTVMPMVDVDADLVEWDQEDDYVGLQAIRGIGGQPGNVAATGAKRYTARPGVYGEFATIDEQELTSRGRLGAYNVPANITDLIRGRQDQLLHRRINRLRKIGWDVLQGTYSVANNNGVIATDTFSVQTYNASTWGTPSTATPLADFRGAQLLSRGHSVSFGAGAEAFTNRATANNLLANTNAADLGGKRTSGLANVLSMADVNNVLGGEDLPMIRIWDDGYKDDSGNFQLFIPANVVIIVGRRSGGARIADFAQTRNANNPNSAPGPYTFVDDRTQGDNKTVPPLIAVHSGVNGGPRIYFPSAIINMDVS
jgi:hypothetical protein